MSAARAQLPVRIPVHRRGGSRPTVEERVALRFPRLVALARRSILRLPPGSRIRSAFMARAMAVAFATYERGDFETTPRIFCSSESVLETAPGSNVDLPSPVRGVDGFIHWLRVWHEGFSSVRWEPRALYDGGDRVVFVVEAIATGRASGIEVRQMAPSAIEIENGLVKHQLATWDLGEALEAAGFPRSLAAETTATDR